MEQELAGLGRLRVEIALDYIRIKCIRISEAAGEHGKLYLELVAKDRLEIKDVLPLEDAAVKVTDVNAACIFAGICQSVELVNEDAYSELHIAAKSYSILADRKRNTRTYQDPSKTMRQVVGALVEAYGGQAEVREDCKIAQILYQNNETDWDFLKRIAAQYGCLLFCDSKAERLRLAVGTFPFARKQLGAESLNKKADLMKDIQTYVEIKANVDETAESYEFEALCRTTFDLTVGAGYQTESEGERPRHCVASEIATRGESVANRLTLLPEDGCRPPRAYSIDPLSRGDYLVGKILCVRGLRIKVHFNCDPSQEEKKAAWITFESPMNNYLYSMPDAGDTVFVYYENNGKVVALGSRRSDGGNHADYADPSSKTLTSTNKMIKLMPSYIGLIASRSAYDTGGGEQSMIEMDDQNGISIFSTHDISVKTEQELTFAASKDEITAGDIQQALQKFESAHLQGEIQYLAGAGSKAPNPGWAIVKQLGVNIGQSCVDSVKSMIDIVPDFIESIEKLKNGPAQPEEPQQPDLKNGPEQAEQGMLAFTGTNVCKLQIGSSCIRLEGDAIVISSPLYRQIGYEKGTHSPIKAPSILDNILDGVQLALDIAGCIPGCNIIANGINAGISLARGDYVGAAASALGCICPGANAVTKVGKALVTASKAMAKGDKVTKWVEFVISGVQAFNSTVQNWEQIEGVWNKIKTGQFGSIDKKDWQTINMVLGSAWGMGSSGTHALKGGSSGRKGGNDGKSGQSDKTGKRDKTGKSDKKQGGEATKSTQCGDPINVVTGGFSLEMTDFRFSDLDEDFVLQRSYESIYENRRQHLGSRWLLNLGSRLERKEDRVEILLHNLHLERFENHSGIWENLRGGDRSLVLLEVKDGYELRFVNDRKIYMYDVFGRLVSMSDANGNHVRIEYVGSAIDRVVLANGKILRFSYENDKLARVTDPLGRSVQYRYEGELLTQVIYPNDGVIVYTYTPEGYIESVTDQNGHCYVKNDYDARGRVVRQELANGGESLLFYRDGDRTTTVSTPHNGQRISYIYNRQKLVTKTVYSDGTEEETRYDDKENVVWKKDRRGNETSFRYNEASQVVEEAFPNGLIHQIQYDEAGRKIEDSDNAGVCIRYSYDAKGNLTEIKSRIEGERWQSVRYEYDAKGRTAAYINENGGRTEYHYKENDSEPSNVTNPEGDVFRYEYDEAGRTMAMESALGRKEYAYNNLDRQTLEIDALGNTTKYEYDKLCNLTNVIYPNQYDAKRGTGKGWKSVYDALDEVVRRVDPEGNVLAMRRDAEENIVKEIHPNAYNAADDDGAGIENVWDADGRKIKIHYPGGGTERIFYDASGNVVKRVEPESYDEARDDGPDYTYTYDEMNRLTAIRNPRGAVEKAYVYDLVGNIVKEIDAAGYEAGTSDQARLGKLYAYNSLGWLTEKREPAKSENGRTFYALTQYQYDLAGNVTEERRYIDEQDEQSASGRVLCIRFRYDRQNRLVKVEDNTGAAVEYAYNCLNQRIFEKRKIAENTHQIFKYHYDAAGRHVETSQRADREGSGKFTVDTKYELDKTGNIVKIVTPAGYMIEREYDDADRLTAETHRDKDSGIENRMEFVYDKANNIVKIKDANGVEELYEYNLMNKETKLTKKNGGIEQNIYDKNGRLVRRIMAEEYRKKGEQAKGYAYTYDEEGRIVSVVAPDGAIVETNVYDGAGRLLQTLDAARGGADYDYDIAGRVKSVVSRGGAQQNYEYDARGNIVGVVDGNRNRTEYRLDAWGRIAQIVKADARKNTIPTTLQAMFRKRKTGKATKSVMPITK